MIACALFTPFVLWHAERLEHDLADKPLVTLKKSKVVEVSCVAARAGVEPDMSLDGARSRCADLTIVETNDATLRHAWHDLLSQLYAFTDRLESVAPGVVFLAVNEVDASLIADQFQARVALAETQEHAHLRALAGVTEKPEARRSREARVLASVDVKEIPIKVLRGMGLGEKNAERLGWLGVEKVGQLQKWSRSQLLSFFGKEAATLIRYLKGPYRTGVDRYTPAVVLEVSYTFEDAALEPWQLEPVLTHLALSLADQLGDRAAARLSLVAESQGLAFTATRVSKEPLRGERSLLGQAHRALADSGVQGLGIDKLRLELSGLYRPSTQGNLFQGKEEVRKAVAAVDARFPGALLRFETLNPYSPVAEFSHRLVAVGRTESEVKRERQPAAGRRVERRNTPPRERASSFVSR